VRRGAHVAPPPADRAGPQAGRRRGDRAAGLAPGRDPADAGRRARPDHLELERDGDLERLPADPDGTFDLTDPDHDVYRIELDTVSTAIAEGDELPFSRPDAVAQATVLQALRHSADLAAPVDLTPAGQGQR
jgi:hypothetical protein